MKSGSEGRVEKLEATAEIQAGRDVDGLSHSMALRAGLRGQMQKMGVQRLTRSHASRGLGRPGGCTEPIPQTPAGQRSK